MTYSESRRVSVISVSSGTSASPSPTVPEFTPAAVSILATATGIVAVTFRRRRSGS